MKLLAIELRKLLPYKAFKLILLVIVISLAATILVGKQVNRVNIINPEMNVLSFPNVWNYYLYTAFIVNLLLAMLVIFVVCNEYTYRTLRQNIIDGMTRNETVTGKIILIIMLSIVSTITVYITGIIAGMMYSTTWTLEDVFERNELLLGYELMVLCLLSLAYLFATIFKRSGIATIAFLLFLFPIDLIINSAIFKGKIVEYMPVSNMFKEVIRFPYTDLFQSDPIAQEHLNVLPLLISVAYIVLFFTVGWFITKRRDL